MLLHHRTLVFRVFVAISLLALTFSALGVTPARAAGGPPYMYIANHGGNNIIQATLGGALSATMTLGGLCSGPSSIALDVANSKMYVTCDGNDRVVRANLDGTVPTAIISSGLSAPGGIALDLTNSKIYIANYSNNTISRANLNGSGLASLGNLNGTLNGPVNMTLNVAANKMYVANYDSGAVPSGTISQANLDGTGGVALTLSGLVGGPSDVKLDLTNNKMYVLNGGNNNHIIQANLNGTAAVDLGDLGGALAGPAGIGLDVPNGKMYIADDNGNNKVYQANLNGTGVVNLGNVGGTINSPYAIDLDLRRPPSQPPPRPWGQRSVPMAALRLPHAAPAGELPRRPPVTVCLMAVPRSALHILRRGQSCPSIRSSTTAVTLATRLAPLTLRMAASGL
jgi:DNA-binding beta-propeller fold protein YncE